MTRAKQRRGACDQCGAQGVLVRHHGLGYTDSVLLDFGNTIPQHKAVNAADLCFFCENGLPGDQSTLARLIVRALQKPPSARRKL